MRSRQLARLPGVGQVGGRWTILKIGWASSGIGENEQLVAAGPASEILQRRPSRRRHQPRRCLIIGQVDQPLFRKSRGPAAGNDAEPGRWRFRGMWVKPGPAILFLVDQHVVGFCPVPRRWAPHLHRAMVVVEHSHRRKALESAVHTTATGSGFLDEVGAGSVPSAPVGAPEMEKIFRAGDIPRSRPPIYDPANAGPPAELEVAVVGGELIRRRE